jgi:hypothetical protein
MGAHVVNVERGPTRTTQHCVASITLSSLTTNPGSTTWLPTRYVRNVSSSPQCTNNRCSTLRLRVDTYPAATSACTASSAPSFSGKSEACSNRVIRSCRRGVNATAAMGYEDECAGRRATAEKKHQPALVGLALTTSYHSSSRAFFLSVCVFSFFVVAQRQKTTGNHGRHGRHG